MTDHVDREKRSLIMASVRSKHTIPEKAIGSLVHKLGYRYRLHAKDLPGKPDLVFPIRRKIVFVHGCFWHRHKRCRYASTPKTQIDFWEAKFCANIARDRRTQQQLKKLGWKILVVWQCELKQPERLAKRLDEFLKQKR